MNLFSYFIKKYLQLNFITGIVLYMEEKFLNPSGTEKYHLSEMIIIRIYILIDRSSYPMGYAFGLAYRYSTILFGTLSNLFSHKKVLDLFFQYDIMALSKRKDDFRFCLVLSRRGRVANGIFIEKSI